MVWLRPDDKRSRTLGDISYAVTPLSAWEAAARPAYLGGTGCPHAPLYWGISNFWTGL
jgi:hypothetical protein